MSMKNYRYRAFACQSRRRAPNFGSKVGPRKDGDLGEQEIGNQNRDRDQHHGARRTVTKSGGAPSSCHHEVAPDDADDCSEDRSLEKTAMAIIQAVIDS